MSVFGPNQREELIIGNALASETTNNTFIASATDKEIAVVGAKGAAVAAGEKFQLLQKTATGYEFSDIVNPSKVKSIVLKEYSAEVLKSVTATVASAAANTTYALEIRIFEDGGTLSPENFSIVTGYYVTGASAPTVTVIRDGLLASLNSNLTKRGGKEFTVASSSTNAIVITGKAQVVVPGKIVGRQIEFDVNGKSFDNTALPAGENNGKITTSVTALNNPGTGTGKYAVNLEWFCKGYDNEPYREASYPINFNTTYYADVTKAYNAIHITYFEDRTSPTLEQQPRVLTILVERANLAGNSVTNSVLAKLRTAVGSANVPADLAVA